jgi:HIV Tat-specific factor 1
VTCLPSDTTLEEISSVFSKCGVIAEEIDRGQPRIKMYESDEGRFKGDALIVYFRPESVSLAIQLLDDTSLRLGDAERMKVQAADFSYKSQQEAPAKSSKRDQKKVIRKTQKLNKYVHPQEAELTGTNMNLAASSPTGATTTSPPSKTPARNGTRW